MLPEGECPAERSFLFWCFRIIDRIIIDGYKRIVIACGAMPMILNGLRCITVRMFQFFPCGSGEACLRVASSFRLFVLSAREASESFF